MSVLSGLYSRKPLRLLFVGNSLTRHEADRHDLPALVSALAQARGRPAPAVECLAAGGASLEEHRAGAALTAARRQGAWDFVVLQESTERALSGPDALRRELGLWDAPLRAAGTRAAVFAVWAPREKKESAAELARWFAEGARDLGAPLAPAGAAWTAALAQKPDLPLWREDGVHAAPLGSYLAACVLFERLYGEPILETGAKAAEADLAAVRAFEPRLSAETAALLRRAAAQACAEFPVTGRHGAP